MSIDTVQEHTSEHTFPQRTRNSLETGHVCLACKQANQICVQQCVVFVWKCALMWPDCGSWWTLWWDGQRSSSRWRIVRQSVAKNW